MSFLKSIENGHRTDLDILGMGCPSGHTPNDSKDNHSFEECSFTNILPESLPSVPFYRGILFQGFLRFGRKIPAEGPHGRKKAHSGGEGEARYVEIVGFLRPMWYNNTKRPNGGQTGNGEGLARHRLRPSPSAESNRIAPSGITYRLRLWRSRRGGLCLRLGQRGNALTFRV